MFPFSKVFVFSFLVEVSKIIIIVVVIHIRNKQKPLLSLSANIVLNIFHTSRSKKFQQINKPKTKNKHKQTTNKHFVRIKEDSEINYWIEKN